MGGKTRNVAIELISQHMSQNKLHGYAALFTVTLRRGGRGASYVHLHIYIHLLTCTPQVTFHLLFTVLQVASLTKSQLNI